MPKITDSTQRAYTLRVQGRDPNDVAWRNALWKTHEAVNNGARVFGDWLLTLRGGLDHGLADGGTHDRKNKRILLALSWLSVESREGAPEKYLVAGGNEPADVRRQKVLNAFKSILRKRGLNEQQIEEWLEDCRSSLSSAIREDAVWVNRSDAFDDRLLSPDLATRNDVWDMLEPFLGNSDAYLGGINVPEDDEDTESSGEEEKSKDLVQKAGQWLSSRFGTGKGADFNHMSRVYRKIAEWVNSSSATPGQNGREFMVSLAEGLAEFNPRSKDLDGVKSLISGPGYKSATRNLLDHLWGSDTVTEDHLQRLREAASNDAASCSGKVGEKGRRPYADKILLDVEETCGFSYLTDSNGGDVLTKTRDSYPENYDWGTSRHKSFAVMLDHAARRVSIAHTWIKKAESRRQRFEADAQKIHEVPHNIREWLDNFCTEWSDITGALDGYRIRRRAIDGWKEVVKAWSLPDCRTKEDRVAAARQLQDNPELDKFGDIQLFEALAEDDALCVWHRNGELDSEPDPQPLIDYVAAEEAEFKKQQFKVPAYRHPDPLLHPVFCDFGNSRWDITFSAHRSGQNRNEQHDSYFTMTLWDGMRIGNIDLRWHSKRLTRDLALKDKNSPVKPQKEVTRADRLGRAAAGVSGYEAVRVAKLFQEKYWNGRLQAPREQLEAIARHVKQHGWDQRACLMRDRIRWTVTFSAPLQPSGPWLKYVEQHTSLSKWPHNEDNKTRKEMARLILCRLPGLRVLSVDLGHRFAAACAIWESLSSLDFQKETSSRKILRGGTGPDHLFCHTEHRDESGKRHVTIYRRIGADLLPDGTTHPAPWARLDRQFLIKLQGEEEGTREASNAEIWAVHQFEKAIGRALPLIDRLTNAGWGSTEKQQQRLQELNKLGWFPARQEKADLPDDEEVDFFRPSIAVDDLMASATRSARLALRRHGDRARIAFALKGEYKTLPGNRKYYFNSPRDASAEHDEKTRHSEYVQFLRDALEMWYNLASSNTWYDRKAREWWVEYIPEVPLPRDDTKIPARGTSGSDKQALKQQLLSVAERLQKNAELRRQLSDAWEKQWKEDDQKWRGYLRWLRQWILPRGGRVDRRAIRHTGGLSLARLATITALRRQVQVAYYTRLRPDGSRAEISENFARKTLDALEELRLQRVKQLASRIVEAALGVGSENRNHWEKERRRPRQQICDPRFNPCQAVVIERLDHYRPEEVRTRRENRQLMTWSAAKVKKYLAEECLLNGLHLREVSAAYTSRQDSRTGAPGMRCQDVSPREFAKSPLWRKLVGRKTTGQTNDLNPIQCFLIDMDETLRNGSWPGRTIRLPLRGGELFISADPSSPAAQGLQADLNAAANIGLRALTDPDWPGRWWYVPCDPATSRPKADRVNGSSAINISNPLRNVPTDNSPSTSTKKRGAKKTGSGDDKTVNLWRDISCAPVSSENGPWQEFSDYWEYVTQRVLGILAAHKQYGDSVPY